MSKKLLGIQKLWESSEEKSWSIKRDDVLRTVVSIVLFISIRISYGFNIISFKSLNTHQSLTHSKYFVTHQSRRGNDRNLLHHNSKKKHTKLWIDMLCWIKSSSLQQQQNLTTSQDGTQWWLLSGPHFAVSFQQLIKVFFLPAAVVANSSFNYSAVHFLKDSSNIKFWPLYSSHWLLF